MAMNLAGRGPDGEPPLIWPDFWTAWDTSAQFQPTIFLDPRIKKFCMGGRVMDLVPGTSHKLCDCPNLFFVDVEHRPYSEFFSTSSNGMMHCLDSLILALDICFQLGFRRFYCVGTELRVQPSEQQIELARKSGVEYLERETVMLNPDTGRVEETGKDAPRIRTDLLKHFTLECIRRKLAANETEVAKLMESVDREQQYSFPESKKFLAAISTDEHYWRTVQYLRLARRNMAINGVQLVSCTPNSRLNQFFPYRDPVDVTKAIVGSVGSPINEVSNGRYTGNRPAPGDGLSWHKDIPIYGHNKIIEAEKARQAKKPCGDCGKKKKKNPNIIEIKDLGDAAKPKQQPQPTPDKPLPRGFMDQQRGQIIKEFNEGIPDQQDVIRIDENG